MTTCFLRRTASSVVVSAHARKRLLKRYGLSWSLEEWAERLADFYQVLEKPSNPPVHIRLRGNIPIVVGLSSRHPATAVVITVLPPQQSERLVSKDIHRKVIPEEVDHLIGDKLVAISEEMRERDLLNLLRRMTGMLKQCVRDVRQLEVTSSVRDRTRIADRCIFDIRNVLNDEATTLLGEPNNEKTHVQNT